MEPLTHLQVQEILRAGINPSLPEHEDLANHLSACSECRAYAALVTELATALPALYPSAALSVQDIRRKAAEGSSRLARQVRIGRTMHWLRTAIVVGATLAFLLLLALVTPKLLPDQPAGLVEPTSLFEIIPTATPTVEPTPPLADVQGTVRLQSPDWHLTAIFHPQTRELQIVDDMGYPVVSYQAQTDGMILGPWSPDSKQLVFWPGLQGSSLAVDGLPMWLLDVQTGQAKQVSEIALFNKAYQSWSPDGKTLAFSNGGYRSAQVGKRLSLYQVESGQLSDLIPPEDLVTGALAWSPAGNLIAVAAVERRLTSGGDADYMGWDNPAIAARRIYLVNPQNGEYQPLTQSESYEDAPLWNLDGSRLYFVQQADTTARLMVFDANTTRLEALPGCEAPMPPSAGYYGQVDWSELFTDCPLSSPIPQKPNPQPTPDMIMMDIFKWDSTSPDGKWVARGVIASPKVDYAETQTYTSLTIEQPNNILRWTLIDQWQEQALGATIIQPVQWSANSRYFYYTNLPVVEGCIALPANGSDLQQVNIETGEVRELLPSTAYYIALSPDESHLAYIAQGSLNLVILDLSTGKENTLDLDPGWDYDAGYIFWSPDGKALALTLANKPCIGKFPGQGPFADTTSILVVDTATFSVRILNATDAERKVTSGWTAAGQINLKDPFGNISILEVSTTTPSTSTSLNSFAVDFSADGSILAFNSSFGGLVPDDRTFYTAPYLYHTGNGTLFKIIPRLDGQNTAEPAARAVSLSDNGRYLLYGARSNSAQPAADHYNFIYLRDLKTGLDEKIDFVPLEAQLGEAIYPSLSPDGRYLALASVLDNWQIYLLERASGKITPVSVDSSSKPGNGSSFEPVFSLDGRYLAFTSEASNLVTGDIRCSDTNLNCVDVFLYEIATGKLERIPAKIQFTMGNPYPYLTVSADARWLAWTELIDPSPVYRPVIRLHDRTTGKTRTVWAETVIGNSYPYYTGHSPSISTDGRWLAFGALANTNPAGSPDPEAFAQVYLLDLQTNEINLVSADGNGNPGNGASGIISLQQEGWSSDIRISGNGRYVAFSSQAANLLPPGFKKSQCNDPFTVGVYACYDLFVYDRETDKLSWISAVK